MKVSQGLSFPRGLYRPTSVLRAPSTALIVGVFFVLALLPRLLITGDFVTVDEGIAFFDWSERFLRAVQQGHYEQTVFVGHPAVTTLWLGAGGALMHQWFAGLGWADIDNQVLRQFLMRLPGAMLNALCTALAYPLLRRLVGTRLALLATLFWLADPFLVAHGQLLHQDALMASFMGLGLLATLLAFRVEEDQLPSQRRVRWRFLLLSALMAALALLTKSPSLLLVPLFGLVALIQGWRATETEHTPPAPAQRLLAVVRMQALPLIVWGATVAVVWVALWPLAWVDLPYALYRVAAEILNNGAMPHNIGNFFLGQAIADPGPLFYPVAIALRLTPLTMIGLFLAAGALWQRRHERSQRVVLGWLALFAVLFTALMTLSPKKFDRYVTPVFPMIDILAAAGWLWVLDLLARIRQSERRAMGRVGYAVFGSLLSVLLLLKLAHYHPYEATVYNPLLGSGPVAAQTIPVSWGEGVQQAAAYVVNQPDGCERPVATWFEEMMGRYTCPIVGPMHWVTSPIRNVGYVIIPFDLIQRNNFPDVMAKLVGKVPPVHVVQINGIPYALVYQLPYPTQQRLDADFGSAIRLYGYSLDTTAIRSSATLTLTMQWQARAPINNDYTLFVHMLNAQGQIVAQADVPPGGPKRPTTRWNSYHYINFVFSMPVRADLPAGDYWIAVGLYNPRDSTRLPVTMPQPVTGSPDDGPSSLFLQRFTLPDPLEPHEPEPPTTASRSPRS